MLLFFFSHIFSIILQFNLHQIVIRVTSVLVLASCLVPQFILTPHIDVLIATDKYKRNSRGHALRVC